MMQRIAFVVALGLASACAFTARAPMRMMAAPKPKFEWVQVCSKQQVPRVGGTKRVEAAGLDLCLVGGGDGQVYCVSNKCPPLNQPASQGVIEGKTIQDPLYGTSFSLVDGSVQGDWCPNLLGKAFGWLFAPTELGTFGCRVSGNIVEVQVDVNAKAEFESGYWAGVLDAKGKATGEYY
uniref:Rieske domain-containing protein n=1 Tax=Phaeomonas parva TaxID=124430 RepID=A0A7S1U5Q0_9STRA|mmetsp:Transcript_32598/g.103425  ORF Transcript_32598/g.103425 Transcript_32598/m.103425 type:complete len:179 (+) Transcript_32598:403-939(+)